LLSSIGIPTRPPRHQTLSSAPLSASFVLFHLYSVSFALSLYLCYPCYPWASYLFGWLVIRCLFFESFVGPSVDYPFSFQFAVGDKVYQQAQSITGRIQVIQHLGIMFVR